MLGEHTCLATLQQLSKSILELSLVGKHILHCGSPLSLCSLFAEVRYLYFTTVLMVFVMKWLSHEDFIVLLSLTFLFFGIASSFLSLYRFNRTPNHRFKKFCIQNPTSIHPINIFLKYILASSKKIKIILKYFIFVIFRRTGTETILSHEEESSCHQNSSLYTWKISQKMLLWNKDFCRCLTVSFSGYGCSMCPW